MPGALANLADGLARIRAIVGQEQWRLTAEMIRRHPVTASIHLDPLTYRGFHKPRGYAVDAVLIDLIYRSQIPSEESPDPGPLGASIWDFTSAMAFARAIRSRRDLIARQIDAVAGRDGGAEVLAIEAGHLREAHLSEAVRRGGLRRMVALERDGHAAATIERELGRCGVVAIHTPRYALLNGAPNALGRFDFIYSAGLFDGIETKPARRAIAAMFAMLKPGGKLLIGNLTPALHDAAYIEAFMDWWPVYRYAAALEGLAGDVPGVNLASVKVLSETAGDIAFLELIRAF
ncbi:MAG TPA: class I SAM-dependent methyltransferase [Candidatus Binataceae bacterium]|nr:class I SAM-dependent methyltransferase [Candidatus Binataceae bacterium]